jgi:DNA (cytosine-5)-methyltransferase 1
MNQEHLAQWKRAVNSSPSTKRASRRRPRRKPRIGSLCTGYGGLDMAAQAVFGGRLTWCADNDRHVSVVLRARFPQVPNLGDLTRIDWKQIDPVDILCAGFPCQDISYAGLGAGIKH